MRSGVTSWKHGLVTPRPFRFIVFLLLLSTSAAAQQVVVFSRRVYAAKGRTYQQLWVSSATDEGLKPLTNSPHDHNEPMCSRDGKRIFFSTGDQSIWSFDRVTGAEHELLSASTWNRPRLLGSGADGRLLVQRCSGPFQNHPTRCTPVVEWHPAEPAPRMHDAIILPLPDHDEVVLSPDGTRLVVNTPPYDKQTYAVSAMGVRLETLNRQTFVTDAPTARARTDLRPCDRPVWSLDGSRLACATGQDITVVDVGTGAEIERIRFSEQNSRGESYATTPAPAAWSPDDRTLLVGTYGENSSSTYPQMDYFLVDLVTKNWTRAMTGDSAVWLAGRNAILYTTPRDLVALPSGDHRVWSAQLAVFDLTARMETVLTTGVTNNGQPAVCQPY